MYCVFVNCMPIVSIYRLWLLLVLLLDIVFIIFIIIILLCTCNVYIITETMGLTVLSPINTIYIFNRKKYSNVDTPKCRITQTKTANDAINLESIIIILF